MERVTRLRLGDQHVAGDADDKADDDPRPGADAAPWSRGEPALTLPVRSTHPSCCPIARRRHGDGQRAAISSVSGSRNSRSKGMRSGAEGGVVERAVGRARRRAWRSRAPPWRSAVPGSGRARQRRGSSRTNSYHDTTPWLVTWCVPDRRSRARRRSIGARSAVNVGHPRWSSTNARAPGCAGREANPSTVSTMFDPWLPHSHDVRTTVASPRGRAPPPRRRAWRRRTPTAGSVGPTRGTADRACRRRRSRSTRRRGGHRRGGNPRPATAPPTVGGEGPLGSASQASTAVHAARCTTACGRDVVIARQHCVAVGHVECRVVSSDDVVAGRVSHVDEVVAELPAGSGDQQPHLSSTPWSQ